MGYRYLINTALIAVTVFVAPVATTVPHAEDSARHRPFILVFFVVRLPYHYAADHPVGTPSRRWTACAGLGGIAVLIVVAALEGVPPGRSAA